MSIDSMLFITCLLPALVLLHWLIPGGKARNAILLGAGLVFCAFGSLSGLLILLAVAAANFFLGRGILAGKWPKLFCALAVTLDLGVLVFFKYLIFSCRSFWDFLP